MCGRITQRSPPDQLGLRITMGTPDDPRVTGLPPRYNGAPGQEHWIIRHNHKTGERALDRLWWGLIPYWAKEAGRKPINAKAETLVSLPMFRDAYKQRRCILPIDSFFEWRAIKGAKAKQPYSIAMRDRQPFAVAAIWENWKRPDSKDWMRTFAVITCPANELVGQIHDRMPVILASENYSRWLSSIEPDPRDLLGPYDANLMAMWPISTRVNAVANDDAGVLEPVGE